MTTNAIELDDSSAESLSTEDLMSSMPFATEAEFEIKGTQFHLTKMPSTEGLKVFHLLRQAFADLDFGAEAGDEIGWGAIIQQVATKMPEPTFTQIQRLIFKHVRFSTKNTSHQPLLGAEDEACKDALDIVDVWVRMVSFNFLESFLAKLSGFNQVGTP